MTTVRIDYTGHLEALRDALIAAESMAGYSQIFIRAEAWPDESAPWVEIFLDEEEREPGRIGIGIPHPDNVAVSTMIRAVAPGMEWKEAAKRRDALVGAVITGLYDQKANQSLGGLRVAGTRFEDFLDEEDNTYRAVAVIRTAWSTVG